MTKAERINYATRDLILEFLSDEEVARVSTSETAARLSEGDEYIDLAALPQGVQRADGVAPVMGHILPRKAVREGTWNRILTQLLAV